MRSSILVVVALLIAGYAGYVTFFSADQGAAEHTREVNDQGERQEAGADGGDDSEEREAATTRSPNTQPVPEDTELARSSRTVFESASISLPLSGSAPTENVRHTIAIEDIRRGCFQQDCIPSVDDPQFISVAKAEDILPPDSLGIALEYQEETRFYPFPMLETHEIVNDVVAGDPLLVTYCPLCGTGIVFERTLDGEAAVFGVSGMLWQSNLLMYNRAETVADRNLWSQVLGEAVVGDRAGERLRIVPSNIIRFSDWKASHQDARVLTTGAPRDPYNGNYYGVASNFSPDFDAADSPLPPSAYVYGIEIAGTFKAYPEAKLPIGKTTDTVAGESVTIERMEDGTVTITDATGETIPDVEGFWFSWVAAHPDTLLWSN